MRYKKPYKCTGWAIVATIERKDGTWYTDTITEIDDDTASSVDTFLNEYIDEKNEEKAQVNKQKGTSEMKIKELIEELNKHNLNKDVVVYSKDENKLI